MRQVKNNTPTESSIEEWIHLFSGIESYESPYAKAVGDPTEILESLVRESAWKSASLSAVMALPPGPFSYLTILPELALLYRLHGHLIKDIACIYGKENLLTRELLMYCLFSRNEDSTFSSMIEESSLRILVRPTSLKGFQSVLQSLGIGVARTGIKGQTSRWIPFLGAAIAGSVSYWDTLDLGKNAIRIFSKEIIHLADEEIPE